MLTLTSPIETWGHRLSPGIKLGALSVITVTLFRLQSPFALLLAFMGITALAAMGGYVFSASWLRQLRPLWPFVLLVSLWHLWLRDTSGGATVILRMITAIGAANLVTMTTRLSEMITLLEWLCLPLRHVGLAPHRLALAVAMMIRFIPVMQTRAESIRLAWSARSPRRPGWRFLLPITLAALDDANYAADALRARGGTD